jgi:hypothetical protein
MIEEPFDWVLMRPEEGTHITMCLRRFVPDSADEVKAWRRIQSKLCEEKENLVIETGSSYRRVLYPPYYSGRRDAFIVCTPQGDAVISADQHLAEHRDLCTRESGKIGE